MSLIKFLTLGRSFFQGKDEKSPYKVNKEALLPKFAPARSGERTAREKTFVQSELLASDASVNGFKSLEKPVFTMSEPDQKPAKEPSARKTAGGAKSRGWLSFEWVGFGRKRRSAKRLVQAEMILGAVQPIRNDLNDSDLELVAKDGSNKRIWFAENLLKPTRAEKTSLEKKQEEPRINSPRREALESAARK